MWLKTAAKEHIIQQKEKNQAFVGSILHIVYIYSMIISQIAYYNYYHTDYKQRKEAPSKGNLL